MKSNFICDRVRSGLFELIITGILFGFARFFGDVGPNFFLQRSKKIYNNSYRDLLLAGFC